MKPSSSKWIFLGLTAVGAGTFLVQALGEHPERAWQAYLINFLVWSAIAQGAFLFSTIMHMAKARWSGPLSNLSESFVAFFPVSIGLFLVLYLGREHVFPWIHQDLHGKEVWLNIDFLFSRDLAALVILYGLGFAYLTQALRLKLDPAQKGAWIRRLFAGGGNRGREDRIRSRKSILSFLYMLAFTVVLSLIGYDLVMAADPHWYSTLFGAYSFVKAVYIGFGGLIILAAALHLQKDNGFELPSSHFHDIGKLFFAFCLVWADFFYAQFVVIWYGNISEETAYIVERLYSSPWKVLAWGVFAVCFVIPFLVLLNRRVKTMPGFMMFFCAVIIAGMWAEHLLLLGPAMGHHAESIPVGVTDILITGGFLGLMGIAITGYLSLFPELFRLKPEEAH
ncbi:MAG: hypothetical protein ACOWWM_03580 [Desulfobacterales bacterium]